MTNIAEKKGKKNVQMHIDSAYAFLDEHLPVSYSAKTKKILTEKGIKVSGSIINNVKNRIHERLDVLNALLIVAKTNKAQIEELIEHTRRKE